MNAVDMILFKIDDFVTHSSKIGKTHLKFSELITCTVRAFPGI